MTVTRASPYTMAQFPLFSLLAPSSTSLSLATMLNICPLAIPPQTCSESWSVLQGINSWKRPRQALEGFWAICPGNSRDQTSVAWSTRRKHGLQVSFTPYSHEQLTGAEDQGAPKPASPKSRAQNRCPTGLGPKGVLKGNQTSPS